MDYKYDIISFDNKIPATIKIENLDSNTRKTELLWHREPELVYVIGGSAGCIINGEETVLDKGDFVLLNSEDVHLVRPLNNSGCSLLFLIFPLLHLSYGIGTLFGILGAVPWKKSHSQKKAREIIKKVKYEIRENTIE